MIPYFYDKKSENTRRHVCMLGRAHSVQTSSYMSIDLTVSKLGTNLLQQGRIRRVRMTVEL